jgi:galactose oxidase-like protein
MSHGEGRELDKMRGSMRFGAISATVIAIALVGACTYGERPEVSGVDPDAGSTAGERLTLGSFSIVPGERLRTPRAYHAMVQTASSIYVIGGMTQSALLADVERATIGADGSLSAFARAGQMLEQRSFPTSVVLGNFLYVLGGTLQSGTVSATMERAPLAPDGSLGPFEVVTGSLVHPRVAATVEVIGDNLYLIGGSDDAGVLDEVERAPIGADGSLGTFAVVPGIKQQRAAHTSHVIGSSLYVLGGLAGSNQSSVDQAAIAGDTFGAFTTLSTVAIVPARANHASIVAGDSVFVIGGYNEALGTTGPVLQAMIDANGLSPFQQLASAAPRVGHTSVRIGRSVYVFGGIDEATPSIPTNTILRAPLLDR